MISFRQFERADKSIDWAAFRRAEIAAGERCYECEDFIFQTIRIEPPIRQLCVACRQLGTHPGEVTHERRIRCPHCSLSAPIAFECVRAYSADALFRDGEAELTCVWCSEKFTVAVRVRHEYSSPALAKPKPKRARRSNRQED